jgi:hypothetical protein
MKSWDKEAFFSFHSKIQLLAPILRILGFFLIFSLLNAHAEQRQVLGGDILYQGEAATVDDLDSALFKATAIAVKAIIVECGGASRDIKIFDTKTIVGPKESRAIVTAGLPFDACEKMKRASPQKRLALTNHRLEKDVALYDRWLEAKHLPDTHAIKVDTSAIMSRLNQGFDDLQSRFDETDSQIQELRSRPTERTLVVEKKVLVGTAKDACIKWYQRAFAKAQNIACLYDHCNLTGQRASEYYEEALAISRECNQK